MLKTERVDCENWDVFSIEAGRHEMNEEQLEKDKLQDPAYRRRREEQLESRRQELLEKLRTLVRDGHPTVAWAAYGRMTKDQAEVVLPEAYLIRVSLPRFIKMASGPTQSRPWWNTWPALAAKA